MGIMLPKDVDVDAASAQHADGLLTVKVPKKLTPAPKPIKIVKADSTSSSEPPSTAPPASEPMPTKPAALVGGGQIPESEVVKETSESVDAMLTDLAEMGFTDRAYNASLL